VCAVEGNRQIVAGLRPLIAPQLDRLLAGEQADALGLNHVMRPAGVLCGRRIRRGAVYRAEFASEKRRRLTVAFMIIFTIGYYVVFTFLPTYFIETLHLTKTNAFVSSTLASLVALILVLPLAAQSDRVGRGRMLNAAAGVSLLTILTLSEAAGRPLPHGVSDEMFQSGADVRRVASTG